MGKTASKRFESYIDGMTAALGHADRDEPFRRYTTGLLLPLERKSVEPIAARVDPAHVSAAHQSLHHFVAKADWSDQTLLSAVRGAVLPLIERHGPVDHHGVQVGLNGDGRVLDAVEPEVRSKTRAVGHGRG